MNWGLTAGVTIVPADRATGAEAKAGRGGWGGPGRFWGTPLMSPGPTRPTRPAFAAPQVQAHFFVGSTALR